MVSKLKNMKLIFIILGVYLTHTNSASIENEICGQLKSPNISLTQSPGTGLSAGGKKADYGEAPW